MAKKHHWIRDDVVIDFPVPKEIQDLIDHLEKMDEEEDYGFCNYSETLDYAARDSYNDGVLTKKQWDLLCWKYSSLF